MAADTPTLGATVRDILQGQGETGEHLVARFTTHALSALDQLGYAAPSSTAKHVRLDIGPRREAQVPNDMSLLLRVSGQVGDHLVPFVPDERVSRLAHEDAAAFDGDVLAADYFGEEWAGWTYPAYWGGAWGAPWRPEAGTYRYFPTERLLRFGTSLPTGLIVNIEYLPSTHVCGPDTPISPLARNAVENYCLWRHSLTKKDFGSADRYERSWRNARAFWQLQHSGTHPLTIARLSDEAAYGRG